MDVNDIVKAYLKEHDLGGLCNSESGEWCSCEIDDLIPCGELSGECIAGYKVDCDCKDSNCGFHIVQEKPNENKTN